jgi:hypothetical protein
MLRFKGTVRTLAVAAALSVSHGLGVVPWGWFLTARGRGSGRHGVLAVGTNRITIVNTAVSTATVDVFCWADHSAGARLY